MMMTNLNNKGQLSKFQRNQIARNALHRTTRPKPTITVFRAHLFTTIAQASYFSDATEINAMISIAKLEAFVTESAKVLPGAGAIDLNAAIYLEENLISVCQAYLEAGKEIMV